MQTLPATRPWFEGDDWETVAAERGLSARERALVDAFRRDGFVVIEDARILDGLDVDGIWNRLAGRFNPDGSGRVQDAWLGEDGEPGDPVVRAIAAHPAVLEALRMLYGREPFPFQTLNFLNGTEQRTHSDTIHFSSMPSGFMCGVWMALEDVTVRQGPLHYYRGSQRLPEFDYEDLGVPAVIGPQHWSNPNTYRSYVEYEQHIDALARESGYPREELAIKRGTFLIWSANLLHGGSPRDDRTLTRKSQVTHYYFTESVPFVPMFSRRSEGRFAVRAVGNICTGRWVVPSLDGTPVVFPHGGEADDLRLVRPLSGVRALVTRIAAPHANTLPQSLAKRSSRSAPRAGEAGPVGRFTAPQKAAGAVSEAQIAAVDRARERLSALKVRLDYADKRRSVAELEARSRADDFWNDPERARGVMKRIADLRSDLDAVDAVEAALNDAAEIIEVLGDEPGAEAEADAIIGRAAASLDELEMAANFDRPYDSHGAIVTIRAGAGGTDAADWVAMLARMYLHWAENHALETHVIEEMPGDEAGLRSITFIIRGKNAYGMLESERGVHRLVRISPFDNQGRRQTSFAEVDVVPEMEEGDAEVEIKPEDLKVETFKASGAGGQYVNKTESAVRVYHLPTGVVVASQQERSQMQNRDVAMSILRAKLVQRAREEQEAKLNALRGDRMANEWGSQIRNYVLHPYQMVKDLRTNVETGSAQAVLEGDLDGFIWPYLQNRNKFAPVAGGDAA